MRNTGTFPTVLTALLFEKGMWSNKELAAGAGAEEHAELAMEQKDRGRKTEAWAGTKHGDRERTSWRDRRIQAVGGQLRDCPNKRLTALDYVDVSMSSL